MTTATDPATHQSYQTFRVRDGSVPDQIAQRVRQPSRFIQVPERAIEQAFEGEAPYWQCSEKDATEIKDSGPVAKIKTDHGDLYVEYYSQEDGSFLARLSAKPPTHDRVGNPITLPVDVS